MILHFIFVVKEEDREKRKFEFEYVQKMSQFYKVWIKEKLRETITWKIRKIEKIRSTLTLMGIEGQT